MHLPGLTIFQASINPNISNNKHINHFIVQPMSNKFLPSVSDLQKTFEQFNTTVITGQLQYEQKIRVIELFLAKINQFQIEKKAKQQKEAWKVQTQASLQDTKEHSENEEQRNNINPNMFYTFLFSDKQKRDLVESNHITKIKLNVDFTSKSLNRVTFYAILVYCFHCTRGDQSAAMPHEQAKHLLRMIKKAQVKAAYLLRESFGRKLYAKTRFLCEKLHENMESTVSSTEKIIKIIVEEFHPCFIDQIFVLLSLSTPNQKALLSLSQNLTRQTSLLSLDDRSKRSSEILKNALQNLSVNLTVRSGQKTEEIGRRCRVNVVVQNNTQSGYCLTEIGLYREWNEVSSVWN